MELVSQDFSGQRPQDGPSSQGGQRSPSEIISQVLVKYGMHQDTSGVIPPDGSRSLESNTFQIQRHSLDGSGVIPSDGIL